MLELPIYYTDASKVELSRTEKKRIEAQKSVVRYDASNSIAYVIIGLRDDPQHYLSIKSTKLERQMKALPIFVLDYLMFYPGRNKSILPRFKTFFISNQYSNIQI